MPAVVGGAVLAVLLLAGATAAVVLLTGKPRPEPVEVAKDVSALKPEPTEERFERDPVPPDQLFPRLLRGTVLVFTHMPDGR